MNTNSRSARGTIYTLGYAHPQAAVALQRLMRNPTVLLLDVRYQPVSRWNAQWNRAADAARIPQGDEYWSICGHFGHKQEAQAAMGIDWMETPYEIAQAIPPAYTAWVGRQLMEVLACS
jgi:hypothetical protein